MRGTYFLGNGAFETRDIPEHPLAPREVLIQVAACGVCGTDVHIYHGDKGSAEVIPPVVLGHELSGTVAAVGAAVKTLHVGDHVADDEDIPALHAGQGIMVFLLQRIHPFSYCQRITSAGSAT